MATGKISRLILRIHSYRCEIYRGNGGQPQFLHLKKNASYNDTKDKIKEYLDKSSQEKKKNKLS